jgi:hypothetical protein
MITYEKRNDLITDILKDGEHIGYVQKQKMYFEVEINYKKFTVLNAQKDLIRIAVENYVKEKDWEQTSEIISEYKNSLRGFKTIK